MQAVVKYGQSDGEVELREVPEPTAAPGVGVGAGVGLSGAGGHVVGAGSAACGVTIFRRPGGLIFFLTAGRPDSYSMR